MRNKNAFDETIVDVVNIDGTIYKMSWTDRDRLQDLGCVDGLGDATEDIIPHLPKPFKVSEHPISFSIGLMMVSGAFILLCLSGTLGIAFILWATYKIWN